MKKVILTVALCIVLGTAALGAKSPFPLSVGGGIDFTFFGEGVDLKASGVQTAHVKNHWGDFNVYAFFDAKYVEVSVGYMRAMYGNYVWSDFGYPLDFKTEYKDINVSYINFTINVKYPFNMRRGTSLAPFVGFAYSLNLTKGYTISPSADDIPKSDWNQMWIKTGIEFDIPVRDKAYIRLLFALDFPLETDSWRTQGQALEKIFNDLGIREQANYTAFGVDVGIAFGYKL